MTPSEYYVKGRHVKKGKNDGFEVWCVRREVNRRCPYDGYWEIDELFLEKDAAQKRANQLNKAGGNVEEYLMKNPH